MNDTQILELTLEIDDLLNRILDSKNSFKKEICTEITEGLNKILEILGIPGTSKVSIINLEKDKVLSDRFMRIILNGAQCRYPDELLIQILNYIKRCNYSDESYEIEMDLKNIFIWLKKIQDNQDKLNRVNFRSLIDFFSLSCLEIVKIQPEILLGSSQIDAYLSSILMPPNNRDRMHQILSKVINHRISIADKQKVKQIINESLSKKRSNDDIVEDLLVALRPNAIQIQMSQRYFKEITKAEQCNKESRDLFNLVRDGLFYELGVRYPDFQFVINDDLNPNNFTFKINHLTTLFQNGLKPDEILVNETPKRLNLLKIDGIPTINPANLSVSSIIHSKYVQLAESAGLTTWDYIGYLVLSFSTVLRKYSPYFIHLDNVNENLDVLSDLPSSFTHYCPELADIVKNVISVESITRLLRKLVSEEISIRNLRSIFESILDFYQNCDFNQSNNLWQNKNDYLTDFVRSSLNLQISRKYTKSSKALVVYLLSPEIETKLLDFKSLELKSPLEHPTYKNILSIIRDELGSLIANQDPIILTKVELRSFLREMIAIECPRIAVLAYNELCDDLNIQPVGRINI